MHVVLDHWKNLMNDLQFEWKNEYAITIIYQKH